MEDYGTRMRIKRVYERNSKQFVALFEETGDHVYQAKFSELKHARALAKSMTNQVCRLCGLCSGPKVGLTFKPEHPYKIYVVSYAGNIFTKNSGAFCTDGVTIKITK